MLGTPPAFTLSQDQTLQFFSEVLNFRFLFNDVPKGVGFTPDIASGASRFRSCFRSAPGTRTRVRDPLASSPPSIARRKTPQRIHVNCSIRVCFRRRVLMSLFSFQGTGAVQRQGRGYWQKHLAASSEKSSKVLLLAASFQFRGQRTDPRTRRAGHGT